MPPTVGWQDIALRLALTVAAGALFGVNRSERGRAAGLVTTVLVCLAASVAMIQTNLLLPTVGKKEDSFINLDLMRLPLGILTGMGFIGGGVILRRGDRIRGVTTAATLWLVTVIGLCFGGGQIGLGLAGLVVGLIALEGMKKLEARMGQDRRAMLVLSSRADGPTAEEVRAQLMAAGCKITSWGVTYKATGDTPHRTVRCEVEWHGVRRDVEPPAAIEQLARHPGVLRLRWRA
ncbi:MAG TPA: MgtC/SapB family protein [Gemmataceae bacterium]|jgi:putative Mg2+ transporter-C (MgtC) family protein